MFEYFSEKARRVIFFARYEAGNYGSPTIETEHLLLGLLREYRELSTRFPAQIGAGDEIRAEIERRTTRRERFSTSVTVPLSADCKKILSLAVQMANQSSSWRVEVGHIFSGLIQVEGSMAAQILVARGLDAKSVQENLLRTITPMLQLSTMGNPELSLNGFLSGLQSLKSEELISSLAKNCQFIDASGKRWNCEEIWREFETFFAPYAKKNVSYSVEAPSINTSQLFVASVLWKNALLASEQRAWIHRMTFVLVPETDGWQIVSLQVTPVQVG